MVVNRHWERGPEDLVFNGYRLSFWEDERILAMVGGAGCAAR
jgi:hypothetical protein